MLSDSDRARIIAAIRAAEERTSGEIYCVITSACSGYRVFPIAYASTVALATPLPLIHFTMWPAGLIYFIQLSVFLLVLFLTTRDRVRYKLVPRRTLQERAHQTALRQFVAHGLQNTERRTGVLIFVSLAERYAEVIADAGINQKVDQEVWRACVNSLIAQASAGRVADGFVAAVENCADVLAQHFPPGEINRDELPNAVVDLG
jgi:putative membrane protein